MSGIVAIFERGGQPVDQQTGLMMLTASASRAVDGSDYWSQGSIALGHHHFWVTPEEVGERQPLIEKNGNLGITADVRLDNRAELTDALDLDSSWAAAQSDSMLILLAYQRWSVSCVARLLGDFAFAIWDESQQHLFVARDPLGVRQIYYTLNQELLLVATEIDAILVHPAITSRANPSRIAEYLALQMDYDKETFFEGIHTCPPGHCLLVTATDSREWRYWSFDLSSQLRYKDHGEYAEHFLTLLSRAVQDRLRSTGPIGISLSGGLDSTSIAAIAAVDLANQGRALSELKTYSYVFEELRSCDERAYISAVVDQYGLQPVYVLGDDKWPLRNLENWPVLADPISLDPYWWLVVGLMEAANRDRTRIMLTGHYGDWLFEGAVYWASDMLRELRLRELWSTFHSNEIPRFTTHLIDNGLLQIVPYRARVAYRKMRPRDQINVHPCLHPELANQTGLHGTMEGRRSPASFGKNATWKRYRDLTHGVVPPTMASIMTMWNHYGIEHLEPMRDRRIVEFVLSVPADQLGIPAPGNNKKLLRTAMQGLLPDTVRLRQDKTTFKDLYLRGLMDKERATVEQILRKPEIVQRGYVDPDWLASALPKGCGYSDEGYTLWRCVNLELWLNRFQPA